MLQQLQAGVLRIPVDQIGNVIVAYEPVWAIGTGVTATSEQAQDMHTCIRGWLTEAFGTEVAESIPVLYGGSCKPSNAAELFSQQDINGGLIGGLPKPKISRGHRRSPCAEPLVWQEFHSWNVLLDPVLPAREVVVANECGFSCLAP